MAVFFIALFVEKCTTCQSAWKSDFGWHRFKKLAYSLALAWGVRWLKTLKWFWRHLMAFRCSISTGKPEQLLSLMCFFFRFPNRSNVVYAAGYATPLTKKSIRFKKPLDIFWPQIQRKRSEEYLVVILVVKRKLWAIFLFSLVHKHLTCRSTQMPRANITNF